MNFSTGGWLRSLLLFAVASASLRAQIVVHDCSDASLRSAIASSSHVVLSCPGSLVVTSTLVLSNNLFLESSVGATLQATNGQRLFYVNSNLTLRLAGMNFTSCNTTDKFGAVIWSAGNVSASNCVFAGNSVHGANGSAGFVFPGGEARGAALFQYNTGEVVFTDCIFSNNLARGGNGATNATGPGSWAGGGKGAAVSLFQGSAFFTNCTFLNNSSIGGIGGDIAGGANAGAVFCDADVASTFVRCTFSNQIAQTLGSIKASSSGVGGGALYLAGASSIFDCVFLSNRVIGEVAAGL
ncbi:MAG TPA: hypothetical protein VNT99_11645 [Methylomirabilota bacterium]|nr:hypothetical protein [Methylomirabilota bacterium]